MLEAIQRGKIHEHTFLLMEGIELQIEAKLVFPPQWGEKSSKTREP